MEFKELIYNFKRMCGSINCNECPFSNPFIDFSYCKSLLVNKPAEVENKVIEWVKKNPEPLYPTWFKFLRTNNFIPVQSSDKVVVDALLTKRVPEYMAKKLGIEPEVNE